jgi:uncharacterized protein
MDKRLRKYVPDFSWMDDYPILRPLHHRLSDHALWALDRHSIARGVALGLFFGILTPVAQILFAAVVAIALRANLPVAAASTLITNPVTFPVIYYVAFRIGSSLINGHGHTADIAISEEAAEHALDVGGWFPTLVNWASSIGPPLLIGVLILAASVALTGFLLVHAGWRWFEKLTHTQAS